MGACSRCGKEALPYEIDPDRLAARGPAAWRSDLVAAPFSAHPLMERDGSVWNFGSSISLARSGVLIWHIGADGKLLRTPCWKRAEPGYLHASP